MVAKLNMILSKQVSYIRKIDGIYFRDRPVYDSCLLRVNILTLEQILCRLTSASMP